MTTLVLVALALVQVVEFLGLLTLTFAMVAQRRRHDRLKTRVGTLAGGVARISRLRTKPPTGEMEAVTRLARTPPPPFPVAPPHTNPMSSPPTTGRHSAI